MLRASLVYLNANENEVTTKSNKLSLSARESLVTSSYDKISNQIRLRTF